MCVRTGIKAGFASAVALLLWSVCVWPLAAANREQKIIESAPRTSTVASNLPGRFILPPLLEEENLDPFRPEMSVPRPGMVAPPPRPQRPSQRVLEMREQKQNWGLNEPIKSIGGEAADDLLKRAMTDPSKLNGTLQGSVANFFRARDKEQHDAQEAALSEFLRTARDTEQSDGRSDRSGDSRNDWVRAFKSPQPELLAPLNDVTANGSRSPFLVDRLSDRSSQQSERVNLYREWLERSSSSRTATPSKSLLDNQPKPEAPAHAIADLVVRPAFSSTSPDASFRPVEPAMSHFAPFGNPEAFRSQTRVGPANSSLAPTVVRPFGPLPPRSF